MDINVVNVSQVVLEVSTVFCPGATNTRQCQSDSQRGAPRVSISILQTSSSSSSNLFKFFYRVGSRYAISVKGGVMTAISSVYVKSMGESPALSDMGG